MTRVKSLKQIKTVVIIGLGLMGGSLAAVLRKKMPKARIIGVSRSRTALKTALRYGWIHEGTTDLKEGVRQADLIVLCTPVQTYEGLLKSLCLFAPQGVLVTDVGSVKEKILSRLPKNLNKTLSYVSAHPMAGSHARGIESVNPKLYDSGFAFIIQDGKASKQAYACIKAFWALVMPRIVEISAKEHDRVTAEISHMPHALAACLMQAVDSASLSYAASGFRDMTRLAAGSADIWQPIFEANRERTHQSLTRVIQHIRRFQTLLKSKSNKNLRLFLQTAENKRTQI